MSINFAFEKLPFSNLTSCKDINDSGISRIGPCPFSLRLIRNKEMNEFYKNVDISDYNRVDLNTFDGKYVVSVGVNHCPEEWTGWPYLTERQLKRQNIFEFLTEKTLKDMREGRAILLLDQSHEGYQTEWLWNWFHQTLDHYKVPNRSIIYVTGNLLAYDQYVSWCNTHNLIKKIMVIPHTQFEHMIYENAMNRGRFENNPIASLEQQVHHKSINIHNIKDYNLLQKRLRSHRLWAFKTLHDAGILGFGLINMNSFNPINSWMERKYITEEDSKVLNGHLPMYIDNIPNNIKSDDYYINRIPDDIMLNSWISLISEASFSDLDNTCFISEKTFKPIACGHPFMIWGNKNSLHYIREMGYKTFHPYIDETYDTLSTWDRMSAIANSLKKFHAVQDKLEWYKSISDILNHNIEVLNRNSTELLAKSYSTFDLFVHDYFGE